MVPALGPNPVSSLKGAPSMSMTRPCSKPSMRIFGPPRSSSTPMQRSVRAAAARTNARRRRRSSSVPCEAFRRTTSTPACTICTSTSRSSVAGPTVAPIFARRSVAGAALCPPRTLPRPGDRRQRLALDELEEGAAAGRDVGDAVLDAVLLDGGQCVAATGEREGLAARNRLGDRARALAELLELEHAHRAVPDDGACVLQQCCAVVRGIRTDVENHVFRPDRVHVAHVSVRGGGEFPGDHHIGWQRYLRAA